MRKGEKKKSVNLMKIFLGNAEIVMLLASINF